MNEDAGVRYMSGPLMEAVELLLKRVKDEAVGCGMVAGAEEMAQEIGLPWNKVRGLRYASKSIYRSELHRIFAFARRVAQATRDRHFAPVLEAKIGEILTLVDPGGGGAAARGGIAAEIASSLELTPSETQALGASLTGDYLLIRRDAKGEIIVSRFQVDPPSPAGDLTTFTTLRTSQAGVTRATGFLYPGDRYTYAIARIAESRSVRLTMLRHCRRIAERDLAGIRLGVSVLDSGVAAAHAIYCHAVTGLDDGDLSFTGAFATAKEAAWALRHQTTHLDAILSVLDGTLVVDDGAFGGAEEPRQSHPWRFGVSLHRDL